LKSQGENLALFDVSISKTLLSCVPCALQGHHFVRHSREGGKVNPDPLGSVDGASFIKKQFSLKTLLLKLS